MSFFDGGKGFSAGGTAGGAVFVAGSFGYFDFDDTDLSLKSLTGTLGYEANPEASSVFICPAAQVGYGFGLEIAGVDFTTLFLAPVVSVGVEAEVSPTVTAAPYAQGSVVFSRVSVDAGPLGDESTTDTSGSLTLGVGFIFNRRLSVGPSVDIPLGTDDGDTTVGVELIVAVGQS